MKQKSLQQLAGSALLVLTKLQQSGRPLRRAFLLVSLLMVSAVSWADPWMQTASNYTASIVGIDKVQFKLPTQKWSPTYNEGVSTGRVTISVDGGKDQLLFTWGCGDKYAEITKNESSGNITIHTYFEGNWQLDGTVIGGPRYFVYNIDYVYRVGPESDDNQHFATVVNWSVPRDLRGKKLIIKMGCHVEDKTQNWYIPSESDYDNGKYLQILDWDCPKASEVSVTMNNPAISYNKDYSGCILIPYTIQAKAVKTATIYYTDQVTGETFNRLLSTKLVDMAYLPADRPWKDVHIRASLTDVEGTDAIITSPKITTKMLHFPQALQAKPLPNGNIELTWKVKDADLDDFDGSDNFEIQRHVSVNDSTSATDAGWMTISSETMFAKGKDTYSFLDNTLLPLYKDKPVGYRVRRSSTTLWRWQGSSTFASCMLPPMLQLPKFNEAFVKRTAQWNDEGHQVVFNYTTGVKYDQEGRFIIKDDNDWNEVKDNEDYKSKGFSNAIVPIFNTADYERFVKYVNQGGAKKLMAVMYGNVDISGQDIYVGSEANPYEGVFNGNGYTLYVKNKNENMIYLAPFSRIGSATISDLTVIGDLTSNVRFTGGLVGLVIDGTNAVIERCQVQTNLMSRVKGNANDGGIVALVEHHSTVTIRNTSFHGSIQGENANSNGGMVGWASEQVTATLENCLFDPTSLSDDITDCKTFVRLQDNANQPVIKNCYYTRLYEQFVKDGHEYYVIRSEKQWNQFLKDWDNSLYNQEVYVILETDVTLNQMIGNQLPKTIKPFKGVFDGNGHTMTVNIDGNPYRSDGRCTAPFGCLADGAIIKNLHVDGLVKGKTHAAGLVGAGPEDESNKYTSTISNVRVSARVETSDAYAAGFIGHGFSSKYIINNCLFDGYLKCTGGGSTRLGGAFLGWSGQVEFKNCLENGTYDGFGNTNYCFIPNPINDLGKSNNYSVHNWTNMGEGYYNVVLNAALAQKLGSGWTFNGENVTLVMNQTPISIAISGATYIIPGQLKGSLDSQIWQEESGTMVPITKTTYDKAFNISVWDPRAKMQLNVIMKGENKTETRVVDLTSDENAINNKTFTYDLDRKCVEYDFKLAVRRANSPLPISGITGDSLVIDVKKQDPEDQRSYKFMNLNKITKFTSLTKQSSVVLEWTVSGGDSDYYRLWRKPSNESQAKWDSIATIVQQFYEDKSVLAQQNYDYKVESILQCEGMHVTSATLTGAACEFTGRVSGYVRMADGTAVAGVKVICKPDSTIFGAQEHTTYTDDTGFYEFKKLVYQGSGKYTITVQKTDVTFRTPGDGSVTFTKSSNWTQGFDFYLDNYYIYSGNVYYRDTSIPVQGVSFLLDNKPMYDASQKLITTDNQGAYTLSIPQGNHSVQAVKDGHYFAADGFLINEQGDDKTKYNFKENVSGIVIWDSTKVVLRGRVVGGNDQGLKPLGQSLSKNNLGDSLKIVMQLEGDNTSYLFRKQEDETLTSTTFKVGFGQDNKDTTQVTVTRRSITIRPDAKTGEYCFALPPAKYKVIEVSAQGYATLFQEGKVGETVDLVFNVRGDTIDYNRIYHAVPTVEVTQFNAGGEPFFGSKKITANDNIGNNSIIDTWYWKKTSATDSTGIYSFDYPVFMANSPYGWVLQACEKYYYNNKMSSFPDIVKLKGGKVSIQNALVSDTDNTELQLDSVGGASYVFTPQNTSFVMTDGNALKTVSITLEYDNTFFDIKPMDGNIFKGFVMAAVAKPSGRKGIVAGTPQLIDVLRDPPGSTSSAFIEAGSRLSYSYTANLSVTGGFETSFSTGSQANIYNGYLVVTPAGPGTEAGTYMENSNTNLFNIDAITYYNQGWNFSYSLDVTERISTSSTGLWIGNKADLFIGMTPEVLMQEAIAVRVIPDSMYQIYKTHEGGSFNITHRDGTVVPIEVKTGAMKVLARGIDGTGSPVYIVRDEVMTVGPRVQSTFVHSQHYIENDLLPGLIKQRNSLILPKGTSPEYAQALANQQQRTTYISTVDVNDPMFGYHNRYESYYPSTGIHGDSILSINNTMEAWLHFMAKNEQEKLEVMPSNLVKRYEFDGASEISYTEVFNASSVDNRNLAYPGINDLGQVTSALTGPIQQLVNQALTWLTESGKSVGREPSYNPGVNNKGQWNSIGIKAGGTYMSLDITPKIDLNFTDNNVNEQSNTKTIGFTLGISDYSSLVVDVYRTATEYTIEKVNFGKVTLDMLDMLRTGKLGTNPMNYLGYNQPVYSSLVYRTRGGLTAKPYEPERLTKWYQPGAILDEATVRIDRPKIWIDQPVVSNVPYDEKARFTLHLANETDYPDRSTIFFKLYLDPASNPHGAKVSIDGKAIDADGMGITLNPLRDDNNEPNVFTKIVEVTPGKEYDYNNLNLTFWDPDDLSSVYPCNFSAHFVPTAGKVTVSTPSSNWVMNTESPYDGKRQQWYMPVKIEGFDVNYRNFDHIELQYKLTTQGEKDWVSVCSYYADRKLMEKANGVTDTIPENGIIIASFYGENDPVEQYYDIRAVNYCRHGNGYLTRSSEVLTGIKDTRLPVAFGTPEPTSGILGHGDDIVVKFSEPIASNYLRNINNFEVLGNMRSNSITTSTALSFNGNSYALTQGKRNLTGKNFTVDVMLNPADNGSEMTVFSHGGLEKGLRFGLTGDRRLKATINGKAVTSDSIVKFGGMLMQVGYVLQQASDGMIVSFYNGSQKIGSQKIAGKHEGVDQFCLGSQFVNNTLAYKGEMLEFRLWNKVLDEHDFNQYGYKRLTGTESGLLDYYPLNDGSGSLAYDKAPGSMDLRLVGTSWKLPSGISMKLDGQKGVVMEPTLFNRSSDLDYTLMFWFNTNDKNGTLFANGEALAGQQNQLNIGLRNDSLYVRSSGFEKRIAAMVNDGNWHHLVLTVSRMQKVANIYIDKKLVESLSADSLQGISSDHIALGATYADKNTPKNQINGYIDEVGMFSGVLPVNLIKEYNNHTPLGTTSSLMVYLPFEESKKMDNNQQKLEPSGVSLKRYVDGQGKITSKVDTLLRDNTVMSLTTRDTHAPIVSNAELKNINYSYVGNENKLYFSINEPDFMVEKSNIYLTIKDIPDLHGNLTASPIMLNYYVYRNPLRWDVKRIECEMDYGHGATFKATVKNMSGMEQNFSLEDLPLWITASQTQGTIGALDEKTITFTVSDYINIGDYQEQISLVGDNSMVESLPVQLLVKGYEPNWVVSDQIKQQGMTMMMVARVKIDQLVASSPNDILAAFDEQHQVLGVAHVEVNDASMAQDALIYLTIYGYQVQKDQQLALKFRFYNSLTGNVYNVTPADNKNYYFTKDAIIGSSAEPVVLENTSNDVQTMMLKKGWNWVSFTVKPKENTTIGQFFNNMSQWEAGDKVMAVDGKTAIHYTYRENETKVGKEVTKVTKWDNENSPVNIKPVMMYNIYSMSDKIVYLEGDMAFSDITVDKGWNRIGYLSSINLPIEQALSEYAEQAQEGDVVKSQDGFAVACASSAGLVWKGSLHYMEQGKGYMLKRMSDSKATFSYPFYYDDSRYRRITTDDNSQQATTRASAVSDLTTMNIVAAVEGVSTETDDQLVVYCGTERMGVATADSEQNYYLNVGTDSHQGEKFVFVIERNGEAIAMANSSISFTPHQVLGTPAEPTVINFVSCDDIPSDGKWYTTGGIMLSKKPTRPGLYINNGKVQVIK